MKQNSQKIVKMPKAQLCQVMLGCKIREPHHPLFSRVSQRALARTQIMSILIISLCKFTLASCHLFLKVHMLPNLFKCCFRQRAGAATRSSSVESEDDGEVPPLMRTISIDTETNDDLLSTGSFSEANYATTGSSSSLESSLTSVR